MSKKDVNPIFKIILNKSKKSSGGWWIQLCSKNGRIIAHTEHYTRKATAINVTISLSEQLNIPQDRLFQRNACTGVIEPLK